MPSGPTVVVVYGSTGTAARPYAPLSEMLAWRSGMVACPRVEKTSLPKLNSWLPSVNASYPTALNALISGLMLSSGDSTVPSAA